MSDGRKIPPLDRLGVRPPASSDPVTTEVDAQDVDAQAPHAGRPSPQDLALAERLLRGDEAAFTALVERYHGMLLRLALVFVSSRAVAEEVVQEAWVGVIEGLRAFEGRSSLKTWIFRILTNRAKTRGVREARSAPFSSFMDPGDVDDPAVDPDRFQPNGSWSAAPRRWSHSTPEKLLIDREAMRRLEQAIAKLPVHQRAVLTLRDIDGLDSDEVCNVLDISETNQRVLLHRARAKVRSALEEYVDRK